MHRSANRRLFYGRTTAFLCILILAGAVVSARAETPADSLRPRRATLSGWREITRAFIYNRRDAYGGLLFDRGVFRRLTPRMDHEYGLDLYMNAPTAADDFAWYAAPNAFRLWLGSIDKSHLITRNQIRLAVPLAARHHFRVDALQEETLAATRLFAEPGYRYNLGGGHRVGVSQTFGAYKPDLDLTLAYEYGHLSTGMVRAELAFLDAFNNLIFDVLGADPVLEDTTRSYTAQPALLSIHAASPVWRGLRGEIAVGAGPVARARFASQARPELAFEVRERAGYTGALAEYVHAAYTAGLLYTGTYSRFSRQASPGSVQTSGYTTRQQDRTVTAYLLAPVWRLQTEIWLSREKYRDVQRGRDFDQSTLPLSFDYRERHMLLRAATAYVPPRRGPRAGLDLLVSDRTFDENAPLHTHFLRFYQHTPNRRLAAHVGYQFRPGAYVTFGTAFDLDGDTFFSDRGPTRFDSAFGSIMATW